MANDPKIPIEGLADLATAQAVHIDIAATRAGLSSTLIERVDAGRQGFPKSAAGLLAAELNVSPGTVLAAARLVVEDAGKIDLARRPLPPNPTLGEAFPTNITGMTAPMSAPPTVPPYIVWATGQFVGLFSSAGLGRVNRNSATLLDPVGLPLLQYTFSLTRRDDVLYTVATQIEGSDYYLAAVTTSGAVVYQTAIDTSLEAPYAVVYEPTTDTLWVSLETGVIRVDPDTAAITGTVPIESSGDTYRPWGMTVSDGKVYVAASRATSEVDSEGYLFEIDAATATITRVSTGTNLRGANDVSFDGVSTFYVSSGKQVPNPAPGLYTVIFSTFVGASVTLTGGDPLFDPTWVYVAFGKAFVSEKNGSGEPRMIGVAPGGTIQGDRIFIGSGLSLGKPAADPWLLWVPNPNDGSLTMIEPVELDDLISVEVGGMPHAAVVVA